MPRVCIWTALLVGLLVCALRFLFVVDDIPSLPPRPLVDIPDVSRCAIDPITPAPRAPMRNMRPDVASPAEHARILDAALLSLVESSTWLGLWSNVDDVFVSSETMAANQPVTPLTGCNLAYWPRVIPVQVSTLRVLLRDNLRPTQVPGLFLAWRRPERLRVAQATKRSAVPCSAMHVRFSVPGVNRERGEAVVAMHVTRRGSGGDFATLLRHEHTRWAAHVTERLSFIDGWCE